MAIDEQGNPCERGVLNPIFNQSAMRVVEDGVVAPQRASGCGPYLFDRPEGSSMRTMAIAIVAPESSFQKAMEAASPVVDSVEFHAPW